MKLVIIGNGLTGSEVVSLVSQQNKNQGKYQISGIYNSTNPVTVKQLQAADVAIVFVPPTAIESLIPLLIESQVKVICGTTGYQWPSDFSTMVEAGNSQWVLSNNFSLGMNLIRHCISILSKSQSMFENPQYQINETHHLKKLDQPSGTAISWQNWLGIECPINSFREADVKGMHQLILETEFETIELKHQAKSRVLFAQGALWAANNLFEQQRPSGIYSFSKLVDEQFSGADNDSI